jgi:nucleoside-diphosphate-sugar epimerase
MRYLVASGHDVYAPLREDPGVFERNLGTVIYAIGLTADFRNRPYETAEAHIGYLSRILEKSTYNSFTYLSSARVYQGSASGREDAFLHVFPDSDGLYNLTKLTGEALCLQTGKGKVARLSNIVGNGASESFVALLLSEASTGTLHLRTSPQSSKDYLLIDDAVRALVTLALRGTTGIFNIASGRNTTTEEILDAIASHTRFRTIVAENAPSFFFPLLDTTKLRTLLSWKAQKVTNWLKKTTKTGE